MWIVIDWNKTKLFGPFQTKDEAEEWLAKQNIRLGQYEDQEVSVNQLSPITDELELI